MNLENKVAAHAASAEEVWSKAYGPFGKVISKKRLRTGAEIGVAFGGHSESLLRNTKIERLFGIDPYRHLRGYADPMNLPQKEFDALYEFVKKRMSGFGKRYSHIRGTSAKAAKLVGSGLGFVYLDADHSYDGVWQDLVVWYPKIQVGGVIGGHDYRHPDFPGVRHAIDQFFRRFGWKINEEGEGVWWVEKKELPVSFIMPAYNAAATIEESIASIYNKNFSPDDELVVVNDCSADETLEILTRLQRRYENMRVINHSNNKGGAAARNTAVKTAENALIFCLDSDNILAPSSVPKLKDYLITTGADVASFEALYYFKTTPGEITHKWVFMNDNANLRGALSTFKFPGSSGNYLFTRESWARAGGYPESAGALDAWGLGFRQVVTGSKMVVMPRSYYYHRHGHESYWVRESQRGQVSIKALHILRPFLGLINEEDIRYITSKKAHTTWFDNLEKHPLRLKEKDALRTRRPSFVRRIIARRTAK